ncbi:hypothetical protein GCM10023216_10070 [Isoptericola chiayiensis]|uniref:Uncharacterized protein n=1 Tax=Isoptericola chiayiensis TaxID=579446 RepID=A0ABP8Y8Y5_9MICO|nr:DUF2255 family protein [Isoptericola chiayiensis]NOW00645.1 hypothetical protein [Isoptericola chiayiensis]
MTTTATEKDLGRLPLAGTARLVGPGASVGAWLVRFDGALYARSAAPRSAVVDRRGRGRMRMDGQDHAVVLSEVAPEMHELLDDAYRARYGRCRPEQVDAMVSDDAAAATFLVRSRSLSWGERAADAVAAWRERFSAPAASTGRGDAPCPCPGS